jgi:hypothetical protein
MRRDWWGTDPEVSQAVEDSLNRCEDPALRILRDLDRDWPVSLDSERCLLNSLRST